MPSQERPILEGYGLTGTSAATRLVLTTSLKVKRTVVVQHFTHQLDAMDP